MNEETRKDLMRGGIVIALVVIVVGILSVSTRDPEPQPLLRSEQEEKDRLDHQANFQEQAKYDAFAMKLQNGLGGMDKASAKVWKLADGTICTTIVSLSFRTFGSSDIKDLLAITRTGMAKEFGDKSFYIILHNGYRQIAECRSYGQIVSSERLD